MSFNMNFDEAFALVDGTLTVTGSSEPLDDESEFVSREVVLQQGTNVIRGATNDALKWSTEAISAPGFEAGHDALALGIEVHFNASPPRFVTGTWSQIVAIEAK
jgi:hypothetical protein